MALKDNKDYQIGLLQKNLQTIRKIAGWTIEDLGEKIGVTKQTISNLENWKTKMSMTQYIAIRTILDYESQEHPENVVLPKAVSLLLDEGADLSEEEYPRLKERIDTIAAATSGGADSSMISALFSGMVETMAMGSGVGLVPSVGFIGGRAVCTWIKKLYKDSKKNSAGEV